MNAMQAPTTRGLKRAHATRWLALVGMWLAGFVPLLVLVGGFLMVAPLRATLLETQSNLATLQQQLTQTQQVLAPFDVLARPEALGTVTALHDWSTQAAQTPLWQTLLGTETLAGAEQLTGEWLDTLQNRPPVPALQAARNEVTQWQNRVADTLRRLDLACWLIGLGALIFGAWNGWGQWALYQAASREIALLHWQALEQTRLGPDK